MKFLDYIQGDRKGKAANEIEKESLTDPFLADAIDGYDTIEGNHWIHIADMQGKVRKIQTPSKAKRAWRVVAAAAVFFVVLSSYLYLSQENNYTNLMSYLMPTPEKKYSESQNQIAADMTQHELVEVISSDKPLSDTLLVMDKNIDSSVKSAFVVSDTNNPPTDAKCRSTQVMDKSGRDIDTKDEIIGNISNEAQSYSSSEDKSIVLSQATTLSAVKIESKVATETISSTKEDRSEASRKKKDSKQKNTESHDSGNDWFIGSGAGSASDVSGSNLFFGPEAASTSYIEDNENEHKSLIDRQEDLGYMADQRISTISIPIVGRANYNKYLKKNIKYPQKGKCVDVKGTVVLEFNVTNSGRPINIQVVKSLCADLDQEAIRLLRKGSDWTPSDKNAQLVVYFEAQNRIK